MRFFAAFRAAGYHTIGVDQTLLDGVTALDITAAQATAAFVATVDSLDVLVNCRRAPAP